MSTTLPIISDAAIAVPLVTSWIADERDDILLLSTFFVQISGVAVPKK